MAGILTIEQLCSCTEEQLLNLPTFGDLSLKEVKAHLTPLGRTLARPNIQFGISSSDQEDMSELGTALNAFTNSFVKVAAEASWRGIESVRELFEEMVIGNTSEWSTVDVLNSMLSIPITEIAGAHAQEFDWRRQLSERFESLEPRTKDILDRRLPAPGTDRPTLEMLAIEENLTKERIRQILEKGREKLRSSSAVISEAKRVAEILSKPCSDRAVREIGHDPSDLNTRLVVGVAIQLKLLWGEFVWRGEEFGDTMWWVPQPGSEPSTILVEILSQLSGRCGPVEDVSAEFVKRVSIASDEDPMAIVVSAAEHSEKLRLYEGQIGIWSGSLADRCVQLLVLQAHAMTTEELAIALGREADDRTVYNGLAHERSTGRRIILTAERTWALSEWEDVEEYQMLVDVMKERIAAHGGAISLRLLQREIASTTQFKASSVQMNATMYPKFKCIDDIVTVRADDEEFDVGPPELCEHMFRRIDGEYKGLWTFDIVVDYERMYKSSTAFPAQAAQMLGIAFDSEALVSCGTARLSMSWKHNLGRIFSRNGLRELASFMRANPGDRIRFTIVGKLEVHAELLQRPPSSGPVEFVRDLIGGTGAETLLDDLGEAIGLDGTVDFGFSLEDLLARLSDRGNSNIRAALVEIHPELAE